MTKTTPKAKAGTKPSAPAAPLIVLGYDEHHKPRAARFPATDAALVVKAAQLMDLKVYQAATEDLAALAKKLPEGRLYGNGRGFVPNIRQSLYSELIVTLAVEPRLANGTFSIGGGLPVNLSGGALIADPVFCSGLISIAEAVNQLRGRAGHHQLGSPRIGLAHAASGFAMQYQTVVVLERGKQT